MEEEKDFRDDLNINRFKLEDECEKQPSLYGYWADLLSDARARKDAEEDRLDLISAEIELQYRSMDTLPGKIKSTEAAIKACMSGNEKLETQRAKVRAAKAEIYHLEVAVKALEQKKSSLDNLVTLFTKGFYSQPDGKRRSGTDEAEVSHRKNLGKRKGD